MIRHYRRMIKDTDDRVRKSLRMQVLDKGDRFFGGFRDDNGLVEAKYAVYRLTSMTAAYCNEESDWYLNEEAASRILIGLNFVSRVQHTSGLFDHIDCNFYSAPDTALCIKRMLPVLHYLSDHSRNEAQELIYEKMFEITREAAFGLLEGGFRTPNHRWAIASNLMECAAFFKVAELEKAAEKYVLEGIDCNEDGEFAEKSAGNYNRINNEAMMTLARYTRDEHYDEYAIRNLRMMLTYIEPDGSIFTANSTRQDNGKRIFPKDYYMEYLILGKKYNITEFLDMANYIFELIEKNKLTSPDFLIHFMNAPELVDFEYEGSYLQPAFNKFYETSGIARVHRNHFTYTLMKDKSNFLYFSNGSITLQLKVAGSFCEHRVFKAEKMTRDKEGYLMKQTMKGWYYLPFKEKPSTTNWWEMDNESRDKIWGPNLEIEVQVKEEGAGVNVAINLKGVLNAPFRVEVAVSGAETIETESFALPASKGGYALVKQGMVTLKNSRDKLVIGPGFGTHAYISGKFGSEKPSSSSFTIYFTDYTAFKHNIQIRTE